MISLSVYVCVCLSPRISLAQYSGSIAICYVLLVLWMTSRVAVMSRMAKRGGWTVKQLPLAALQYRGGVWCLWMLVYYKIVRVLQHWSCYCNWLYCVCAAIPLAEPRSEPAIYFFDVVGQVNTIFHLFEKLFNDSLVPLVRCAVLSLIHIWRCRRIERCRSRWSPYH